MKQTAVEWLIQQLSIDQYPMDIPKILEKAKEMEKQQIEISDEDIMIGAIEHCKKKHEWWSLEVNAMVGGAKWYREQLKKKQ